MLDIAERPGCITKSEMRAHFESVVKNSSALKSNTPLGVMEVNGVFRNYFERDTDTMWLGFALGMRRAERVAKEIASTVQAAETGAKASLQARYEAIDFFRTGWLRLSRKHETNRLQEKQERIEHRSELANQNIRDLMRAYDKVASDSPGQSNEVTEMAIAALEDAVKFTNMGFEFSDADVFGKHQNDAVDALNGYANAITELRASLDSQRPYAAISGAKHPIDKPDVVAAMSWDDTTIAIRAEALKMDEVHAKYPGKENKKEREAALRPYIATCVSLHYRRMVLVRFNAEVKGDTQ